METTAIEEIAWQRRSPPGRWVTGLIARRRVLTDRDLWALVLVLADSGHPVARGSARATLDRWWDGCDDDRARIWYAVWLRLTRNRLGHVDHRISPALAGFLLAGDPRSPHVPRIRLVAGIDLDAPRHHRHPDAGVGSFVVSLALGADDPAVRDGLTGVLSTTDEPLLLDAIEAAFASRLHADLSALRLWDAAGEPTPVLRIALANPHLPRPAGAGTRPALAVLMALRERYDLLAGFEGESLVADLLHSLGPQPYAPAVRRALRNFGPGAAREAVCRWAMDGDDEAVDAAVEAGYRPADPDAVPLFLVLTGQWDGFRAADPETLYRYGVPDAVERLLDVLHPDADTPPDVRRACLRLLRDLPPGSDRDALCDAAMYSDVATEVALASGATPSDPELVPAFLAMTGQWDRYDAVDPDGTKLRRYTDSLYDWERERDRLRESARRAGRPMPCEPSEAWSRSVGRRAGGTGTAGTGGFSVHV
ncbi:hypothetical protein Voc01_087160 [Virgisporangium ochraceum]|uniref:Uncharacterized protein n=1 Tax=Virgisporangium ochraceum TaxID=65505 RepID=A0A8J4A0Z3_9ACTN|nr:hypothetical protein Voc01_087160 [Virgisporangium ochraceum]